MNCCDSREMCQSIFGYAGKYGDKDIWDVVPKYFKKNQDEMAKNVSTPSILLKRQVRMQRRLMYPSEGVRVMFNQHCMRNNLPDQRSARLTQDLSPRGHRGEMGVTVCGKADILRINLSLWD